MAYNAWHIIKCDYKTVPAAKAKLTGLGASTPMSD